MESNIVKIITAVVLIVALAFGATALALNWGALTSGTTLYSTTDLQREKDASFAEGAGSVEAYTSEIAKLKQALVDKEAEWTNKYNALWDEYQTEVTRLNGEIQRLEALVDVMFTTMTDYFALDLENGTPTADALNMQLQFFKAMKENAELSIERETETLAAVPDLNAEKDKIETLNTEIAEIQHQIDNPDKTYEFIKDTIENRMQVTTTMTFPLTNYYFYFEYKDPISASFDIILQRGLRMGEGTADNITFASGNTDDKEFDDLLRSKGVSSFSLSGKIYAIHVSNNDLTQLIKRLAVGYIGGLKECDALYAAFAEQGREYDSLPAALKTKRDQLTLQQQIYDGYLQQKAISEYLINAHTSNLTDTINPYITELEERIAELESNGGDE